MGEISGIVAIAYDSFVSFFSRICYPTIVVICSHPSGYKVSAADQGREPRISHYILWEG